MIKYEITKMRTEYYSVEQKQSIFHSWLTLGIYPTYEEALKKVQKEQALDAEGLPKTVWRSWR